jgi:uncharacterized protein YciI
VQGFVLRLIPPRPTFAFDMSPEEGATMLEHVGYWTTLAAQGTAVAYGQVAEVTGGYGLAIVIAADLAAAQAIRDGDPATRSSHGFRYEIAPMLRLVTPSAVYDAPTP